MRLAIVQVGEPVLRQAGKFLEPAELLSPEVQQLIELMRETMRQAPGVGLAAPQIGVSLQLAVIEDTAAAGNVVIVAHAASLALASRGDVLRVLVTASTQIRQRRLAGSLGVDEKEAARAMKRGDAGRADYIKRFYGIGAERPTHYDVVINTDKLTPDDAARLIVDAVAGSA